MRPLLGFARLPARALEVVRRVVDDDATFRSRVAAAAEEVDLSRPAWLFLVRPEGWAAELEELLATARAEIEDRHGDQDGREMRRRVRAAEASARRVEEALARERDQAVRTAQELRAERRSRQAIEQDVAAARRLVDSVTGDQTRTRRALEEATAELARLRPALDAGPDLETLASEIAQAAEVATSLASRLRSAAEALSPSVPGTSEGMPDAAVPDAPVPDAPVPDAPVPDAAVPDAAVPDAPAPPPAPPPRPRPRSASPHQRSRPSRRPAPLPPGVRDDSPEAAEHLVRLNGTVLVVDGYNASLAWRPTLPIGEQRRRLVDALEELATRTQSHVHVVFDGAEPAQPVTSTGPRRLVRARFSPPDVEADDIVVGLVDDLPAHRPVVVASNDRAVREDAEQRGANVISVSQLMAVLRREH
jgi:predicted RNA-binding protein with PIN domain